MIDPSGATPTPIESCYLEICMRKLQLYPTDLILCPRPALLQAHALVALVRIPICSDTLTQHASRLTCFHLRGSRLATCIFFRRYFLSDLTTPSTPVGKAGACRTPTRGPDGRDAVTRKQVLMATRLCRLYLSTTDGVCLPTSRLTRSLARL